MVFVRESRVGSMEKRDAVREAYDAMAETYADRTAGEGEPEAVQFVAQFFDKLGQNAHVLDAGCGGDPVQQTSMDVVGMDFSREQLHHAPDSETALVQGDMTALPFQSDRFHGVTAFFSLIHIPLDDHQTVLDEFARVLRSDGWLLVTEGADEWCGGHDDWLGDGVEMTWEIAGRDETRAQLQSAGFEVVDEVMVVDSLADDGSKKPYFLAQYIGV